MRVVVVGATGFIGSNVASSLLRRGDDVIAFSRKSARAEALGRAGVEVVEGDLSDLETVSRLNLGGVDVLIHCASTTTPRKSISDPEADEMDVASSAEIFDRAIDAGVGKIVFSSSGGTVYGNPTVLPVKEDQPTNPLIPYARTKVRIESNLTERCSRSGTTPVILRYGNPYGPNQYPMRGTGVVTAWLEAARDKSTIHVFGHPHTARDFVFISDAVEAMVSSIDNDKASGTYNIGTGNATSLETLLETVERVVGTRLDSVREPPRPSDSISKIALDSTRARDHRGWKPRTNLEEGMSATWRWVQAGAPFLIG